MDDLVMVPREAFDRLTQVAAYVSMGRGYIGVQPYPDATARAALGMLDQAGLLTSRYDAQQLEKSRSGEDTPGGQT